MTLTRFLFIILILVGSTIAFLSFAPPQTHKYVFMWQAYALNGEADSWFGVENYGGTGKSIKAKYLNMPETFHSVMEIYDPSGIYCGAARYRYGAMINAGFYDESVSAFVFDFGSYQEHWSREYDLIKVIRFGNVIFDSSSNLDHRADFGIPLE